MITVYNARDVSAFLQVAPNVVGNWQARHQDTPKPTHQTRGGSPLWDESGMAAWLTWQAKHKGNRVALPNDLASLRNKLMS